MRLCDVDADILLPKTVQKHQDNVDIVIPKVEKRENERARKTHLVKTAKKAICTDEPA